MTEPTGGPPIQEPTSAPTPPPPAAEPAAALPAAAEPAASSPADAAPAAWQAPAPVAVAGPAPGVAYAGLGVRIGAYIIDVILLFILGAFVFIALGALFFGTLIGGNVVLAIVFGVLLGIANLVISAVYFIWGWTRPDMRASLGQRVLGLQVLNAADGATLTRDQAIQRWAWLYGIFAVASAIQLALNGTDLAGISSLVSLLTFAYWIFLVYTTYSSAKKQGYHDVKASTFVVKRSA